MCPARHQKPLPQKFKSIRAMFADAKPDPKKIVRNVTAFIANYSNVDATMPCIICNLRTEGLDRFQAFCKSSDCWGLQKKS